MAKRINTILSGDDGTGGAYGKAMNIVRTETHRVREAGFLNCAENLSEGIEERGLIYAATWRTMKDEKVRPKTRTHSSKGWRTVIRGSANHEKMEGVTIKVGEEFDLGGRVKTKCPGMSGDAANDCNCRCYLEYNLMTVEQFARITGKSVAEVEKTMSPATKNSQFYKAATLDYEDEIKTERQDEITLYRASTTNNTIYVSDKVPQFKPKELHEIDMNISKTLKLLNIDKEANLPKVYIIGKDEMAKSAIASYSAVENAMFLVDMRGFDKDAIKDLMSGLACPKNELSTYVHEYIHWKDAEEYRKLGHAITNSKEYADYIAKLQKRALKNIDKLIKSGYNINDISAYAFSSYVQGYYDEAYTEYLVKTFMKE
jgi:4-hydroxy-3-methylbut-2-enyl diphosphate reductase IspH